VDVTGMTVEQVVQAKGQPKNIIKAGPKTIYVYDGYKITFANGKVTGIE
jgi:hypothetical protein